MARGDALCATSRNRLPDAFALEVQKWVAMPHVNLAKRHNDVERCPLDEPVVSQAGILTLAWNGKRLNSAMVMVA